MDVLILLISYVCIAFNIYRQVKVAEILDALLGARETFSEFEFLTYWQTQMNNVIAFTVFLAWIKVRCRERKEPLIKSFHFFLDFQICFIQQNDDPTLGNISPLRQRCTRLQCDVYDCLSGLRTVGLPSLRFASEWLPNIWRIAVSQRTIVRCEQNIIDRLVSLSFASSWAISIFTVGQTRLMFSG